MDLYLDFFERPADAVRRVQERRPVALAVLALILAGASQLAAQGMFRPLPGLSVLPWAVGFWCVWKLLSALWLAALTHYVAESWSERPPSPDSGVPLFVLFGFAELVWTAFVPVALLVRLATDSLAALLFVAAVLVLAAFSLKARAVRDLYGFAPSKAAIVLAGPYLAAGAALGMSFGVGLWSLASLVAGLLA